MRRGDFGSPDDDTFGEEEPGRWDAASDADDAEFDEDGESVADTATTVVCPHCGEENEIAIDPAGGAVQEYVEDCQVCCRPWQVRVTFDAEGHGWASVE